MTVAFNRTDTWLDGLVGSPALPKALGSQVAVAHVWDAALSASSRGAAGEQLSEYGTARLASARDRVSQAVAVRFSAVPAGSPARGQYALARSDGAGLTVLGSRRLGLRTKCIGRMRAAPCAAAVAPGGYRGESGFVPSRIGAAEAEGAVWVDVGTAAEERVNRPGEMNLVVLSSPAYGPP
jgi:hypothetical protein